MKITNSRGPLFKGASYFLENHYSDPDRWAWKSNHPNNIYEGSGTQIKYYDHTITQFRLIDATPSWDTIIRICDVMTNLSLLCLETMPHNNSPQRFETIKTVICKKNGDMDKISQAFPNAKHVYMWKFEKRPTRGLILQKIETLSIVYANIDCVNSLYMPFLVNLDLYIAVDNTNLKISAKKMRIDGKLLNNFVLPEKMSLLQIYGQSKPVSDAVFDTINHYHLDDLIVGSSMFTPSQIEKLRKPKALGLYDDDESRTVYVEKHSPVFVYGVKNSHEMLLETEHNLMCNYDIFKKKIDATKNVYVTYQIIKNSDEWTSDVISYKTTTISLVNGVMTLSFTNKLTKTIREELSEKLQAVDGRKLHRIVINFVEFDRPRAELDKIELLIKSQTSNNIQIQINTNQTPY